MNDYKAKKSKGSPNKKKGYKRMETKESNEFSKLKESANDPNWYYYSEQSLKDVGRFSFNNALGVGLEVSNSPTAYLNIPGIMNIYTTPSIGYSNQNTSAANLAAKNIYSFVRHANSGHANYDSPDLFMYLMAIDSCYSMYSWMCRIYGLAKVYIQQNRYYGARILQSMGLDSDDFAANLASFRTFINQYAIKLSAFYVPANMSLYKRHIWMYGNAFADEDDPKAGIYMYQPAYLLQYDEVNGQLIPYPITCAHNTTSGIGVVLPGINKVAAIENAANALLNAIIASEDMNIMSGDILKAYGQENCWKFAAIPDDYMVIPIFSEEVLLQIHNTDFAGNFPVYAAGDSTSSTDAFKIYQNTSPGFGTIMFTPVFKNMCHLGYGHVFDSWKREVTPEDVLVGSRNKLFANTSVMKVGTNYYAYALINACGSEICLFATIWTLDDTGNYTQSVHYSNTNVFANLDVAVKYLTEESRFNQAPLNIKWAFVGLTDGVKTVRPDYMAGDLSNYTVMDYSDIIKLHDTALLSEFAVPFLGNAVKK